MNRSRGSRAILQWTINSRDSVIADVRHQTMSRDSSTFCNQINDAGRMIEDATMNDLREVIGRSHMSRQLDVSLARNHDMDSGIEIIGTPDGTAIFGCEDSLRGSFAFYYCDPLKAVDLVRIGIHEVPKYAYCENLDNVVQIAELFFQVGELDRRFSWMVDVDVGNGVSRENLLTVGNDLPLGEFIERVKQRHTE